MAAAGHVWPVIDLNIRYLRPVKFHETITVVAKLEEYEYRLRMSYKIMNAAGEVTTEGITKQVAVDLKTNEMCLGSPQVLFDRLGLEP
jgi:acyl-CoA thioester hydrolase